MKTTQIELRLPENALALEGLNERLAMLRPLHCVTPAQQHIPAGSKDGSGFVVQAIRELEASIADLIHTDLVFGRRWNGGWA